MKNQHNIQNQTGTTKANFKNFELTGYEDKKKLNSKKIPFFLSAKLGLIHK